MLHFGILITFKDINHIKQELKILEENDCKIFIEPLDNLNKQQKRNKLKQILKNINGVIANGEIWDEELIKEASGDLKIIARLGVGYDNVDLYAATKYGIAVTNTPGANSSAVAEHTLALMLSLARNLPFNHNKMKKGMKDFGLLPGLEGKKVGIIGLGNIGKEVVRRLANFDVELYISDPIKDKDFAQKYSVNYVELDNLLKNSDFISIHCPLNESTHKLLNENKLSLLKKSAYLINTSRGKIIDEEALVEILKLKKIAGAGLDKFTKEPLDKDNPLFNLDNVILSPYNAAFTKASFRKMGKMVVENILAVLNNEKPKNLVNVNLFTNGIHGNKLKVK